MPGLPLSTGATNPKNGAVQYDSRRVDGLPLKIQASAGITEVPVGSVVSWQEDTDGNQIICTGAAAYTGDEYATFAVIGVGFLEASTQNSGALTQTPNVLEEDNVAAIVMDTNAVAAAPVVNGSEPTVGGTAYVTRAGLLSSSSSNAVQFPGEVFYGTPSAQLSGQLKTDYAFARLSRNTI